MVDSQGPLTSPKLNNVADDLIIVRLCAAADNLFFHDPILFVNHICIHLRLLRKSAFHFFHHIFINDRCLRHHSLHRKLLPGTLLSGRSHALPFGRIRQ
jgi:hypothetical protein